ncbi:hypothetical protein [Streptomyces luteireticuli]|uniref:Uncharacterized protein n=1 Tax=Streptomyces luteireticuli TaxID=173858 RepID=A0ABP3IJ11_9ACTN
MAEVSFPFNKDSEGGGRQAVGQTDWQIMAQTWGGDRVDFRLTASSYDQSALPFAAKVTAGRTVTLSPGSAWVGGFYYQLDAPLSVEIGANWDRSKDRRDTIVLRADLSKGAVNIAVVQGQPSARPVPVQPRRKLGQAWEMVLHEVLVPRGNGVVEVSNRAPYDVPSTVAFPWGATDSARFLPNTTFFHDADSDARHVPTEYLKSRDGIVPTRSLGKSYQYTPQLINARSEPRGFVARGRWRWVGPNAAWFAVDYRNDSNSDIRSSSGEALSIQLPRPLNGGVGQAFTGYMINGRERADLPNYVSLTGMSWAGNSGQTVRLLNQAVSGRSGLDYLTVMPARSSIVVSGIFEANQFNE